MDNSLLVLLIAGLVIGILLFVMISLTKKHHTKFDKENYQIDFLRIENSLKRDSEASYSMAIINGDKLLDRALW